MRLYIKSALSKIQFVRAGHKEFLAALGGLKAYLETHRGAINKKKKPTSFAGKHHPQPGVGILSVLSVDSSGGLGVVPPLLEQGKARRRSRREE